MGFKIIDSLPLSVSFLLLACVMWLAYEIGFRIGRTRRDQFDGGARSQASYVVSSIFALTAFFLAFTFNETNSRLHTRKQLAVAEANVIGTAYLRAQLLPQPYQEESIAELQKYVDLRLLGAELHHKGDMEGLFKAVADSEAILDRLWQQVLALHNADSMDAMTRSLFTTAINEVIDTHTTRVMVGLARLPGASLLSIGIAVILSLSVLGYQGGLTGVRSVYVTITLIFSLSSVCILIVSLDRPTGAIVTVSQAAMQDLKDAMSKP